ncbi:MAG: BolA/IbaG family iron-sulfur metabolism protein [Gammaproteobacteria bacterium]|nr:BolA/IbaG family iron-sulfur metabolism protein [Gammaproteobacteria bacterium]
MEKVEIIDLIKAGIVDAEVFVEGEGCNFTVVVVSHTFEGQSLLKKQKQVMATVAEQIRSGALHAIAVKAYTPDEWGEINA